MGGLFTKTMPKNEINYKINDKVSFTKDGKPITGRILQVTCHIYSPNMCDLGQSFLTVIDDNSVNYKVSLTEPTLKIEKMTIEEARKMYNRGSKVNFIHQNEPKTGIITGIGLNTVNEYISDTDSIHVILDGSKDIVRIPLTDPTLQLVEVPIPVSGKQKYTLEEDSKYRVKYMKYKAKYLAQKNN
jgi:hypothetical protein